MSFLLVFVLAVLTVAVGAALSVIVGWLPRPTWMTQRHVYSSILALVLASGFLAAIVDILQTSNEESGARPIPSSSTSAPNVPQPASSSVSAAPVRTPRQWAAEVDVKCRDMELAFDRDDKARDAVDQGKLQSNDKAEIEKFAVVIGRFQDHYATLAAQIHNVPPPAYSAEAVKEWLDLFDERGERLNKAASAVVSGGMIGALSAWWHMSKFSSLSDDIEARGEQLGIRSC